MIDEIEELKAYVTEPDSDWPRLQPKALTGDFSKDICLHQIDQPLILIARAFIHDDKSDNGDIKSIIHDTSRVLIRWCGFDSEENRKSESDRVKEWFKKYPASDEWLKKYWSKNCKRISWKAVKKKWGEKLNSTNDYYAVQITYRNVIASALNQGKLKRRYMVFKCEATDKGKPIFYDKFEGNTPQEPIQVKMLKNIAYYLMLKESCLEKQKEVEIKRLRLLGWYGQDDGKNDKSYWYFDKFKWNGVPIMEYYHVASKNIKMYINEEFLRHFDFKLVDVDKVNNYRENYWIFEDKGNPHMKKGIKLSSYLIKLLGYIPPESF